MDQGDIVLCPDGAGHYRVGEIAGFYKYENGDKVRLIYSKDYPDNQPFWYGITATALGHFENEGVTHVVFILGTERV